MNVADRLGGLLRHALASAPGGQWEEDHARLDGHEQAALTPAAVLIAIDTHAAWPRVLLTRRSARLQHHPGQISFPGGRLEADDSGPVAAALRESREEIGLPDGQVEVLGQMPEYRSRTGFSITPVVGLLAGAVSLRPDPLEVSEVFSVPLGFLLDPANRRQRASLLAPRRRVWTLPYRHMEIWGVTAGMLVELHRCLTAADVYSQLLQYLGDTNCD